MSAAQRDSNATQEEKQQKKHKKHSKQYSEEPTEEETPEQPEETPEKTTEETTEEQPTEEQPKQRLNPRDKLLKAQEEADKEAEEAEENAAKNRKPYISFGKLYYEYAMNKFKGPGCKNLTKIFATISKVSKPSNEYNYKDGEERFIVNYSILEFLEQFKDDKGEKTWKSFDIIGMIKEYQSEFPDKYDYRYCLSDRLTVTKDVKNKILENNGLFTIYVKWYDNKEHDIHKFIYNSNMKDCKGLILSVPKTDTEFKDMIEYYKNELPEFVDKYTYKIYDDTTKINSELDEKRHEEQFNRKTRFLSKIK